MSTADRRAPGSGRRTSARRTTWPSPARSGPSSGSTSTSSWSTPSRSGVRDALAGVAIGGTIGFFLNASGPLRDGAWLKLARDADLGGAGRGGRRGGRAWSSARSSSGRSRAGWSAGRSRGRSSGWGSASARGWPTGRGSGSVYGLIGGALGGFGRRLPVRGDAAGDGQPVRSGAGARDRHPRRGARAVAWRWSSRPSGGPGSRSSGVGRKGGPTSSAGERSALGLDERAEVGLFGDPTVARRHAEIVVDGRRLRPPQPRPGRPDQGQRRGRRRRPGRSATATGSSWARPSSSSGER